MSKSTVQWTLVRVELCELAGPYECPCCGGHIMFDGTYLEQVHCEEHSCVIRCPYCDEESPVQDD